MIKVNELSGANLRCLTNKLQFLLKYYHCNDSYRIHYCKDRFFIRETTAHKVNEDKKKRFYYFINELADFSLLKYKKCFYELTFFNDDKQRVSAIEIIMVNTDLIEQLDKRQEEQQVEKIKLKKAWLAIPILIRNRWHRFNENFRQCIVEFINKQQDNFGDIKAVQMALLNLPVHIISKQDTVNVEKKVFYLYDLLAIQKRHPDDRTRRENPEREGKFFRLNALMPIENAEQKLEAQVNQLKESLKNGLPTDLYDEPNDSLNLSVLGI